MRKEFGNKGNSKCNSLDVGWMWLVLEIARRPYNWSWECWWRNGDKIKTDVDITAFFSFSTVFCFPLHRLSVGKGKNEIKMKIKMDYKLISKIFCGLTKIPSNFRLWTKYQSCWIIITGIISALNYLTTPIEFSSQVVHLTYLP